MGTRYDNERGGWVDDDRDPPRYVNELTTKQSSSVTDALATLKSIIVNRANDTSEALTRIEEELRYIKERIVS